MITAVPGPVYHSAPNTHAIFSFRVGASIHLMPRFDPEGLLALIERERVTHLHLVPIMFERLLKLPQEVRERYDISSLRFVVHAAAPVSPATKRSMIDWWGPIIHEYYGSTEVGPVTFITAEEWLEHEGSVGRTMEGADIRILDDDGNELEAGDIGEIAAGSTTGSSDFTYHRDEAKRRAADRNGLFAPGDVGYFDEHGYLFLCDRKIDMIISGGVNIYPAEIEAALLTHPAVADAAAFGIPHADWGEEVKAVVEVAHGHRADDALAAGILAHCERLLARYKRPRTVDFIETMPRDPNGKLYKRRLREPYWEGFERAM
jgi:long-chain acyl-CoA synthetase